MFIWIYRLIFAPVALLALPRMIFDMRRRGGYGEAFLTRFGWGLKLPAKREGARRIWIQAVSLGEMLAMESMILGLAADERNEIFLTATTSTGYAVAKEKYGDVVVGLAYFPLDFWPFSRGVWGKVEPDLAICAETELWPEHLRQAKKRGAPIVLVNARLSDRSFRVSLKLKGFVRRELENLSFVFAGSLQDRDRFVALGYDPERIEVTGNMKVDVDIGSVWTLEARERLRGELHLGEGLTLLGSSTWPGEEAMMLELFRRVRARDGAARLIIVPRHGERRDEIRALLKADAGDFSWHFKSGGMPPGPVDILVADTHGELRGLTAIADLAFVGKSLPPHTEGQTPIECGLLGTPMVFGSGMSNFKSVHSRLVEVGAARKARGEAEALEMLESLAFDATARGRMSEACLEWSVASKGALGKTLAGIERFLERKA